MTATQRSLRGSSHVRLRVGLVLIAMLLSLFGARLFQLQGVDSKAYAARADAAGLVTVTLPATRGSILDRDGVPLAESVSGMMVVADPTRTAGDAEAIAKIIAERLQLDYFEVLEKLTKEGTRFVYIDRRVPSTVATALVDELESKEYVGVDTRPDPLRTYPAGDVAANLIGFLGDDADEVSGGLERSFNELLAGKDGTETYEVGGGNRIPLGDNSRVEAVDGKNLRLTVDRDVQWYAQRLLRATVESSNAQSAAAVVMDSRTGELLALADYPTFDPEAPGKARKSDLGSRALSDVYEPGSVEKVLTAAALLDAGKVSPTTRIKVPSELPVLDRTIGDWFDHGLMRLTLAGVIARSSNIGTALAATKMSPEELWSYLDKFGLGRRTEVGIPGETRGLLPPPESWSVLTRAQIAFGQGLSVNAVQMTAAVNAIANDGELVTPSLVRGRATTSSGTEVGTATARSTRAVSPEAARKTAEMMELVTTPDVGTAAGAGIEGYRVAGKTGTAQQVGATCKCYDGSMAVSFGGFAPADDPRFTVYVVVQRPRGGASGGGTAGPVFRKIMTHVLQKYAVAPTGSKPADIPIKWGRHAGR
ncbi:MAG TPA: penicillin-binding protein 2 [Marmoricola sp.]|nr:penicillin-binding protein 2 [Marmoricola sp.]